MRNIYLFIVLLLTLTVNAQKPFEELGLDNEVELLTLSDGRYVEHFANDTLRQIGSVMFNTVTNKVEYFITDDELEKMNVANRNREVSRFLSRDPKATLLLHISPYSYALNNPINVIDPDGEFPILINGWVAGENTQRASSTYWNSNILNTISKNTGYSLGNSFTGNGNSTFSGDFYFVDGDKGIGSSTRQDAGRAQAKVDAQIVWNKMKESLNKEGQVTEQLQVVTHSRGSAYGRAYMKQMSKEIIALSEADGIGFAYDKGSIFEYSVNLAPHQSNQISYDKNGTKNINISHIGDPFSGDDAKGNVINVNSIPETESGPIDQHINSSFNTELNFILQILEGNTNQSTLLKDIKAGYENYDNNRTNGDKSTVTSGGN